MHQAPKTRAAQAQTAPAKRTIARPVRTFLPRSTRSNTYKHLVTTTQGRRNEATPPHQASRETTPSSANGGGSPVHRTIASNHDMVVRSSRDGANVESRFCLALRANCSPGKPRGRPRPAKWVLPSGTEAPMANTSQPPLPRTVCTLGPCSDHLHGVRAQPWRYGESQER